MKQIGNNGSLVMRAIEMNVSMTSEQNQIIKAKNAIPIRAIKDFSALKDAIIKAAQKVGCKFASSELPLVFDFLVNHYPNITAPEISLAFDMACLGVLNDRMNEAGQNNNQHFGVFSPMYIAKVLNAYIEHSHEIISPVLKSIPEKTESEISEDESKKILAAEIKELAEEIRIKGQAALHHTMYIKFFYNWFFKAGLVPELAEPTEEEKTMIYRSLRQSGKIDIHQFINSTQTQDKVSVEYYKGVIRGEIDAMFWNYTQDEVAEKLSDYANNLTL